LGEPTFKDSYAITQNSIGYEFKHAFNEAWSLTQNFRFMQSLVNSDDVVYVLGFENIENLSDPLMPQPDFRTVLRGAGDFAQDVRNYSLDTHLLGKFVTGPLQHTLLVGVDYGHFGWDYAGNDGALGSLDAYAPRYGVNTEITDVYEWTYQSRPRQLGIYVQEQAKLYEHWVLLVGGRYDHAKNEDSADGELLSSQDDSAFSGRAGLLYLFSNSLSAYGSYGTSFLPLVGTDRLGNPFDPETGKQSEVGIKYILPSGKMNASLAVYDITRDNMLTKDPINPNFNVQLGRQRHRGVEVEVHAQLVDDLAVSFTYAKLDATVVKGHEPENDGNRPWNVPETTASAWASYAVPFVAGLSIDVGGTYQSDATADEAETFVVPSYFLLDAALHYRRERVSFSLNAENLADKRYISSCYTTEYCSRGEGLGVVGTVSYQW